MTKILIGVDATARSEDAIAFARQLALAGTADVVVASIIRGAAEREEAHRTVRRMSGLLRGIGAERVHTGVVAARSPAQGLHQLAEEESAALLVVGSTHTGHLGRVRPGATGERLLSGAPCAVAVVPYGYRTRGERELARIGVAYNGSAESRAALDAAVAAARGLKAELRIVTVIGPDTYSTPAALAGSAYLVPALDLETEIRKEHANAVASVPADVRTDGVVLEGRPWRELADKSAHLDLLVVGSRGYGPLQAVLLGGTSGPLAREAHCPVIALPRGVGDGLADVFHAPATAAA